MEEVSHRERVKEWNRRRERERERTTHVTQKGEREKKILFKGIPVDHKKHISSIRVCLNNWTSA